MSIKMKIWYIVAASLIVSGLIIFAGVMTVLKWDFKMLSISKFETSEHVITEAFTSVSIDTKTADIKFVASDNSECSVVCYEQINVKHSVSVKDGKLTIKISDTRKWYEHIGINFNTAKITVYIPKGEYGALQISSSTGDIEIPKGYTFESIEISENTGNVKCYANADNSINIKTTTGDISVDSIFAGSLDLKVSTGSITASNVKCNGELKAAVSTGKTNLSNIECKDFTSTGNTGSITLRSFIAAERINIKRSTGDVKLDGCDARDIFIETDTGDVKGILLTEKVFITKTDTGKVDVPKTVNGGRCEIKTDTGDIKISIE